MSEVPNLDTLLSTSKCESRQKIARWKVAEGKESAALII